VRLLVARHAPVEASGLCYGRKDVPAKLDPAFVADRLARTLHDARPWLTTWSSPSSRCAEPARMLAERLSCGHHVDGRLHELSFGEWEGRTWASLEVEEAERFSAWMNEWQTGAPPGGESPIELTKRVEDWWRTLPRDSDHLLVAHAGVIRGLLVVATGISWEVAMKTKAKPLEWIEIPTLRLEPWDTPR